MKYATFWIYKRKYEYKVLALVTNKGYKMLEQYGFIDNKDIKKIITYLDKKEFNIMDLMG